MTDVKNAIIVSEYYPEIMPSSEEAAQPITRLTPRFHDITVENVTATGSTMAGVIIGLPESPISALVLRNVSINAQKGLSVGYAEVSGSGVVVHADSGAPLAEMAGAKLSLH
jgi:hypothetical protein